MAARSDQRHIGGLDWQLTTVDGITAAKTLARLAKQARGLAPAAARAGSLDGLMEGIGEALGMVEPDALIEDGIALLLGGRLQLGPKWNHLGREELAALTSGNADTLVKLCAWAVELNYPFVATALVNARASRDAASRAPSAAATTSPGSAPA